MSDEETFESADAGAAHCIPFKAGDLRKGSFVAIKGHPCKVRAGGGGGACAAHQNGAASPVQSLAREARPHDTASPAPLPRLRR